MNLRILLITGLLLQALVVSRTCLVIEGAPGQCTTIPADAHACTFCCTTSGATTCPPPSDTPPPDDQPTECCCCVCLVLRDPDARPPATDPGHAAQAHALAADPSYPILTQTINAPVPPAIPLPPPDATRRRAILCCWTT